jgi:hypothetical protein
VARQVRDTSTTRARARVRNGRGNPRAPKRNPPMSLRPSRRPAAVLGLKRGGRWAGRGTGRGFLSGSRRAAAERPALPLPAAAATPAGELLVPDAGTVAG